MNSFFDDWCRIAREVSLKRLERREHSVQELRTYLEERRFPEDVVAKTLEVLVTERLLDEGRFAREVTRSELARDKGPAHIAQKLREKGVDLDAGQIRELMAETSGRDSGEFEIEKARALVAKKYPHASGDEREHRRAFSALMRRGFSHDVARAVLTGFDLPDEDGNGIG